MRKVVFTLTLLLATMAVKAQSDLDSLYSTWQDETKADTNRAKAYKDYIWDGFLFSDPDSARILADELTAFGKKNNMPKFQAWGLNIKGASFYLTSDLSNALDHFTQSLKIREQLGDQSEIAGSLNNIAKVHSDLGDYPIALDYFTQSLKIREQIGDLKMVAASLNEIGAMYYEQSDYPIALDYFTQSLKIDEQRGDLNGISSSLSNIGFTFKLQGDYPKALDYLTQSLKIEEQLDSQYGKASTLLNIGIVYRDQGNYPKAMESYTQSLEIAEEMGDQEFISFAVNNIGIVYQNQGDYPNALEHYRRSLKISEQQGNLSSTANALHNIGSVYGLQGDPKALDYFIQSLEIEEQRGNQIGIAVSVINIGVVYRREGNYPKALNYCQQGYELALSIEALPVQKDACKCLYDSYKYMGKTEKALEYHILWTAAKDSLFNEENTKKLTQLEMQYEFDKKEATTRAEQEKKDVVAAQELERQKIMRNGFVGGFAVMLLFAGVFFVQRNRIKKEKERSEELLLNILPEQTAQELKEKGHSDAQLIDQVTVLFTDFKGFTSLAEQLSPKELVNDLNICFSEFDRIMQKYGIEKIKTIGDAYMAAGGLPAPNDTHAMDVIQATFEMRDFVEAGKAQKLEAGLPYFEIRIGVNTGPVVAGIVGVKKFQYDIWGDTVNTASRMESSGEVGKVNISQATYDLLKDERDFKFESRGKIEAKGKGEVDMYFVSKA